MCTRNCRRPPPSSDQTPNGKFANASDMDTSFVCPICVETHVQTHVASQRDAYRERIHSVTQVLGSDQPSALYADQRKQEKELQEDAQAIRKSFQSKGKKCEAVCGEPVQQGLTMPSLVDHAAFLPVHDNSPPSPPAIPLGLVFRTGMRPAGQGKGRAVCRVDSMRAPFALQLGK